MSSGYPPQSWKVSGRLSTNEPIYFTTPAEFRDWLAEHHDSETELLVGFYKAKSGIPGITWSDAVDEALCYGWIDGIGRRVDDQRRTIRFTPRRKGSIWSAVNVAKVEKLTAEGRMQPAGLAAFARRSEAKTGIYSHERTTEAVLDDEQLATFQANPAAWEFFQQQAPSYRRAVIHWIITAKRPETQARRLATAIEDSAAGRRVKQFTRR